jgi:hypothetical protein
MMQAKISLSAHPLYEIHRNMIARCERPTYPYYKDYGGRGISVCPRWKDPWAFIEDMGPTYEKGLSLDRINVDADYSPENCRWIPRGEQQWNKRNNRFTEPQYRLMKLAGVRPDNVKSRLRLGWTLDEAMSTPIHKPLTQGIHHTITHT